MMIVGNKVDLEADRKVPLSHPLKEYKDKFDIDCWEVSAKTGYNVKEVFSELIESIAFAVA
jgi:GTPase SAR1 family protein